MVLYHKLSLQINSLKNKKIRYGWYSISNYYSINLLKKKARNVSSAYTTDQFS